MAPSLLLCVNQPFPIRPSHVAETHMLSVRWRGICRPPRATGVLRGKCFRRGEPCPAGEATCIYTIHRYPNTSPRFTNTQTAAFFPVSNLESLRAEYKWRAQSSWVRLSDANILVACQPCGSQLDRCVRILSLCIGRGGREEGKAVRGNITEGAECVNARRKKA